MSEDTEQSIAKRQTFSHQSRHEMTLTLKENDIMKYLHSKDFQNVSCTKTGSKNPNKSRVVNKGRLFVLGKKLDFEYHH